VNPLFGVGVRGVGLFVSCRFVWFWKVGVSFKYVCIFAHTEFRGLLMPKQEKGKSHEIRPVSKRAPNWCKYQPEEVEALIVKLAKEGNSPSRIGTILRDQYSVPLAKPIIGKRVMKVLRENELAPSLPEDLASLLKKAESLSLHLEKNRSDLYNKRALQLIEAKIHKLSRYYKQKGAMPSNWKYEAKIASIT
jgi:small subunit ribosomal protein S15